MTKPVINKTSCFICTLSEEVQKQIRKDLENHAEENGYTLEIDEETGDYIAMSGRFCDIEEVYN